MRQEKLKNWACMWIVGGITAFVPILLIEGERILGPLLAGVSESDVLAPLSLVLFFVLSGATVAVAHVLSQRRASNSRPRRYEPVLRLRR